MLPQLGVRGIVILDRRGIRGIFGTRRRGEELGEQEGRRGSGICGGHVGRGSLGRATDQRLQDAPGAHSRRHRKMSLCGRNGWTREFKCEVGVGLLDPTTTTEDAARSFSSTRLRRDKQRARWSGSSREAIESSPPPPPPPPARCRNRSSAGHRVLGCRTGNTPGERSTLVQSAARATARDSITKRPLAIGHWQQSTTAPWQTPLTTAAASQGTPTPRSPARLLARARLSRYVMDTVASSTARHRVPSAAVATGVGYVRFEFRGRNSW